MRGARQGKHNGIGDPCLQQVFEVAGSLKMD